MVGEIGEAYQDRKRLIVQAELPPRGCRILAKLRATEDVRDAAQEGRLAGAGVADDGQTLVLERLVQLDATLATGQRAYAFLSGPLGRAHLARG